MTKHTELSTADIATRSRDPRESQVAPDETEVGSAADANARPPSAEPLFDPMDADQYRKRWTSVQGEFVNEPRQAVQQADSLVADLMQKLATEFSSTRESLERQWDDSTDVSTEDLRIAMTRYRSFFERLLSV